MKSAARGQTQPLETLTRAEVARASLQHDARVLRARGMPPTQVARTLGVSRRTLDRWGI